MTTQKDYFKWLCSMIEDDPDKNTSLLSELYNTQYEYSVEKDCNRYIDGVDLRKLFKEETGEDGPSEEFPCSVLEMLIAFARRMETEIMQNPLDSCDIGRWFWMFIDNLYLNNDMPKCRMSKIIHDFMARHYDGYGNGNIFHFKTERPELKDTEIWYQMHMWIIEREKETEHEDD